MHRDKRHLGKRSFPGRLTVEQWLEIPWRSRIKLIWRAQADLLGSFRYCADKRCRRHRLCVSDDPEMCWKKIQRIRRGSRRTMVMPKTMYREWDRLNQLNHLYMKDGRVMCAREHLSAPAKSGGGGPPEGWWRGLLR